MAPAVIVAMIAFVAAPLKARRVQNTQEIFGLETLRNRTQSALETVRGHAQSGLDAVVEHTQIGFAAVANTTQDMAAAVADRTQTAAADAAKATQEAVASLKENLICDTKQMDYAQVTLTSMCPETDKHYDCVAGVFSVPRGGSKNPKKDWVQCLEHPPMLTYGEPTCEKADSDDKTTYVLACNLCLAHTKLCFHWAAWAVALIVLSLCCCCCCLAVCCGSA